MFTMVKNRDYTIDNVRALSALEIIAFWHMMDYLPDSSALTGYSLNFAKLLTNTALATFSFISGFCLAKYTFNNKKDVLFFYKKRLIRFYPLLLLSSLTLLVAGYIFHHHWFVSKCQFFTTITGVNFFFPPLTMTLWYFSMIMFFYMITPIVLSVKQTGYKIIVATAILVLILMADILLLDVDGVFYLYYPFYVLGLIIPSNSLTAMYRTKSICLPLSIICFAAIVTVTNNSTDFFMGGGIYIAMISGLLVLFSIAAYINNLSVVTTKFLYFVSYSSMVAYLFHRQFYYVTVYFLGDSNKDLNIFTALGISVPIIFLFSFAIQKAYDYIVNKLINI